MKALIAVLLVVSSFGAWAVELPTLLKNVTVSTETVTFKPLKGRDIEVMFVRAPARQAGNLVQYFDMELWKRQVAQSVLGGGTAPLMEFLALTCAANLDVAKSHQISCDQAESIALLPVTIPLWIPVATVTAFDKASILKPEPKTQVTTPVVDTPKPVKQPPTVVVKPPRVTKSTLGTEAE